MLGNWRGSGVLRNSPDGQENAWTSIATVKKILDGHYIQEDNRLTLEGLLPVPLVFRTIYAWDRHSRRYLHFSLSNVDGGEHGILHWTPQGKMIISTTKMEMGRVVTEQAVTEVAGDSMKTRLLRSIEGGKFFVEMEGSYRRGGEGFEASRESAAVILFPPPEEMGKLRFQLGTWRARGKYRPGPGAPLLAFQGRQEIQGILGGHAHRGILQADPPPGATKPIQLETYAFWNAGTNSFQHFELSNYGGAHVMNGYLLGKGKMVYTGAVVHGSLPILVRSLVDWNESRIHVVGHRMAGDLAPESYVEMELKPGEDE